MTDIARKMRDMDCAMLMTHDPQGHITGRPMNNARSDGYRGDSYFFAWEDSQLVRDIERNPRVAMAYQGHRRLLGSPGVQISVEGMARVVRDRKLFAEHWSQELERWFRRGVQTPGLVMIHVHARRVHYWDGADEGEFDVA